MFFSNKALLCDVISVQTQKGEETQEAQGEEE